MSNYVILLFIEVIIIILLKGPRGSRGRDRMVVIFTTTYAE
jgi:hypothetical protein